MFKVRCAPGFKPKLIFHLENVIQAPLQNRTSGIHFESNIYVSTAMSFLQEVKLLIMSSNSYDFLQFWICLDMYCVGVSYCIEMPKERL